MAEKKTAAKPSAKAVKTTTASKVKKADQEKETAAVNIKSECTVYEGIFLL